MKRGRRIITFEGLRKSLKKDGSMYIRDKVIAERLVKNMTFRYLMSLMDKGIIFRAIRDRKKGRG